MSIQSKLIMISLPDEIWTKEIGLKLNPSDLRALSLTCKHFASIYRPILTIIRDEITPYLSNPKAGLRYASKKGRIISIHDGRRTWIYHHTGKLIRYECPEFTTVFTLDGQMHHIKTRDGEYVTYKGERLYSTRMGYPDGNPILTTDDFAYEGNLDE